MVGKLTWESTQTTSNEEENEFYLEEDEDIQIAAAAKGSKLTLTFKNFYNISFYLNVIPGGGCTMYLYLARKKSLDVLVSFEFPYLVDK